MNYPFKILKRTIAFLLVLILIGCSSKSWIASFVKYNDTIYVTDEAVEQVGNKIGEVKYFLKEEMDAKDLSSNEYPVGTEIYEIEGIDVEDAIAIKNSEGEYIKLIPDTSANE